MQWKEAVRGSGGKGAGARRPVTRRAPALPTASSTVVDRGSVAGEPALRRREALRSGLIEMLKHDTDSLFSIDAQAVQTHVVAGDPAEKILEVAEEVGADLICAGTTGKSGLERILIGSVALRLLHKSPIPLLFAH